MGSAERKHTEPARKQNAGGMRLFEWPWRSTPALAPLPPLLTAMRQLRHYVIDAHGDSAALFVERAQATAARARESGELETAAVLMKLAAVAELGNHMDVRAVLADLLDLAYASLKLPSQIFRR